MATIDIMLPVYNEAADLERNTLRLRDYIDDLHLLTHDIRIVIVDNASTDATTQLGPQLAIMNHGIDYMRLEQKGRGHALKTAWLASNADVVAYMDLDLSTSLSHLPDLLLPLTTKEADLTLGSRLSKGSLVAGRSMNREILSRGYNHLLRFTMNARFDDAQCGFKAIRREAFMTLAEDIEDDNWFFDTELLLKAQYRGLRLLQIPVVWLEDETSTVNVRQTIMEDLRGMARVYRQARPYSALHRLISFGIIGVICTIGYGMLYWLLAELVTEQIANLLTLSVMTVLNVGLNRHFTYRRYGREQLRMQYGAGIGAFLLSWVLTGGGLWLIQGFHPNLTTGQESVIVTGLSVLSTIFKYFIYGLIFHERKTSKRLPLSSAQAMIITTNTQPIKELA